MGFAGEEIGLDVPLGRDEPVILVADDVAVLDDAADLDVGQAEDLGLVLVVLALDDELFEGLAGEGDDGAVGVDGAACDIGDAM